MAPDRQERSRVMERNTICAISTPPGISGIGIIRLSGKSTYPIIGRIFRPKRKTIVEQIPSHTVTYGHITAGNGKIVDEVLVSFMRSPKSYTREDMAEIGCHGGIIPLREILNLCIKHGARPALPGEFTKRAFLNGRIDLTQAESVLEIINSKTEKSLYISLNKLKGSLKNTIENIREQLMVILSALEAEINFPEEQDIKNQSIDMLNSINRLLFFIENFMKRAGKGKIMYAGINSAILGRTNAGKSSLLNALLREERAIVTEVAGTTRDSIQESINIRGIPVNIIDTAGIRKVRGKIEKLGIKKSLEWMEKAEINLLVLDGSKKLNSHDRQLLDKIKKKLYILIINKTDLPVKIELEKIKESFGEGKIVLVSAKTGKGLEELEEKIFSLINRGYGKIENDEIFLNARQESKIHGIREQLEYLRNNASTPDKMDIAAEYIKNCLKDIDELTGRDTSEETINRIFSQFCIGK